ncbi:MULTISPECIES: hypothetical protein [unclassified Campylobacter]|uniref:hypothetical protein n=1 Tax=unclassified Campylobacter TaxID=2593542 RepID=UPI001D2DAEFE|nr:hypothetical protein [Campylobacter sp. RM12651]MBZ7978528.1 hypothetical protein [Campylobacter sp. RM12654]MBZ7980445.1 hypothetical protein [Campylobacter sp. RM12642]MBZ7990604.1 hypothetical protein [Campylobacter sp. RM9331]MBZ8004757.1 hypothetical protein [Campylobacter sp. RM9332]MBZ8007126.1 hypothetical protein [Campylobacter sp. RM9334]
MSEKELEIFKLGKDLANILSSNEAKADLKALYDKHPEMFKNLIEVKEVIQEVVSNPEVVKEAKNNIDVYAMKKLDKLYESKEKIGDVVIGKNNLKIYHANKMRVSELKRIQKNINLEQSVDADPNTLHTTMLEKPHDLELMNKNSSGANALSTDNKDIIQENNKKFFSESLNKAIEKGVVKTSSENNKKEWEK